MPVRIGYVDAPSILATVLPELELITVAMEARENAPLRTATVLVPHLAEVGLLGIGEIIGILACPEGDRVSIRHALAAS